MRTFFVAILLIGAVAGAIGGTLAYQSFVVNKVAPRPYNFIVTVNGDACGDTFGGTYSTVTWNGRISSDGNGIFEGQGCGTQSWSVTGGNLQASFTDLSSYVSLDLTIMQNGQQCFAGATSSGPVVSGSCP